MRVNASTFPTHHDKHSSDRQKTGINKNTGTGINSHNHTKNNNYHNQYNNHHYNNNSCPHHVARDDGEWGWGPDRDIQTRTLCQVILSLFIYLYLFHL